MRNLSSTSLFGAGLAATALLASSQALAYNQGDYITRVGVAHVDPKSDNGSLASDTIDVKVDSDANLGFTLGYLFHDKLGVELLAALPFKHDIELNGVEAASTKHLPPTLTLQYYPLGGTAAQVQPYAGIGLNYTHFFSEEIDIEGADLELDSSWGLAGQLGVDVRLDDSWGINAAAWYVDIDTDASLDGTDIGEVNIDPWVFMAGISYRF